MYYENGDRDEENSRVRKSKYDECFEQLPDEFDFDTFKETFGLAMNTATSQIWLLKKRGAIEAIQKGKYKKLKKTLS